MQTKRTILFIDLPRLYMLALINFILFIGEKKTKQFYGYRFKIRAWKGSEYVLQAGSKEELEEWISKLSSVCKV